jgi:hypothetical protein
VRADAKGHLQVRNPIYERVFDREWVLLHLPDAEVRRQKAALKVSQKTRVTTLRWAVPPEWIAEVRAIEADARGALHIDALELVEGGSGEVTLTLELPPDGTPDLPTRTAA